ncbi:MAG TPA: glycosyltransferase [Candidatus Binataceae bacterium]|nr:glycosyltransferase [Candidatus Binataceae bacterium]
MTTTITVAIPTHNRAATLSATLGSIAALAVPAGAELDCIVVDNGSTDATPAAVDTSAKSARVPVRRVFEKRLGSSFARNRAIAESRSEFIFFIDDDALAEPSWAVEMLSALTGRALDGACGMVLPRWTGAPPPWLGRSLWVKLAVHDREKIEAEPAERAENLANYFSANVGLRRDAFARFGTFREDLGNVGGNPMSGEDTELFARIIAGGGRMGFAPRAIVNHLIPAERMTREYLRRKSFAYGVGSAFAGGRHHNQAGKLIRNAARMAAAALRCDSERAIYHELECANFLGYWRGRMLARSK